MLVDVGSPEEAGRATPGLRTSQSFESSKGE